MIDDKYKGRSITIGVVLSLFVLIFIFRLAQLQLFGNYAELAEGNAFYRKTIYASRGLIYDRNGKLLVYNQPTYDLMVINNELNRLNRQGTPLDTAQLCQLLNISIDEFDTRIANIKDRRKNPGYSPLTPQRFITQLSPEEYAVIQEHLRKFPGFSIQGRTLRNYAYPCGAHVLGSIGEVSQSVIDQDPTYHLGDYAGTDGMERSYEKELRGENGMEILLRDARGRIQGSYKNGEQDKEPVAGADIISTLDVDLQILAEDLLQGKIGSVVAIEPHTGEVLALASNPTWNPSHLVGRLRSTYYPMLLNDECKPLLNRATQGVYSPGSTFKTLQALVCQQEGGITPNTMFACNGPGAKPIKCTHHHGSPVILENALKESCNPYFWNAYRQTLEKNGYGKNNENFKAQYERWRNGMLSFGLGPRFDDTDILGLRNGAIPTQATYNKWYGERGWKAITIRSNSIGQGEVEVTPIQLANAAATIANKGYYITPHINRADSMLTHRHRATVDSIYYDVVHRGMWRMYQEGSGRWYPVPNVEICGKTGTTDNSHGKPHSIFIGFAPADNPQIAVAVIIENAGFGSMWALPIASFCIEQYLNGKISETRQETYNRIKNTVLNSNVKRF